MKWMKHDSDAHENIKIKRLLLKHGAQGYGVYWYCLEAVAAQITKDNIDFEIKYNDEVLADLCKIIVPENHRNQKTTIDYMNDIMRTLIDLNLFQEKDDRLYAYKLAERIDNSIVKNPQIKRIQAIIRENKKQFINKLSTTPAKKQIPDNPGSYIIPDEIPDYEEINEIFREDPGYPIISTGIRENPGQSRTKPENPCLDLDIEVDSESDLDLELDLEREGKSWMIPDLEKEKKLSLSLKKKYHNFVYMLNDEYIILQETYGKDLTDSYIKKLNNWIGKDTTKQNERKNLNHYYTLLDWMQKDCTELPIKKKKVCPTCGKQHDYFMDVCKPCHLKEVEKDWKQNPVNLPGYRDKTGELDLSDILGGET